MPTDASTGDQSPRIRRGRVDSLTLYEITDHELELLDKGSPNSVYLNFAIFLASVGFSFLLALLTTTIASIKTYVVFVVIAISGLVSGGVLFALWYRTRSSVSEVVKRIRERVSTSPAEVPGSKSENS